MLGPSAAQLLDLQYVESLLPVLDLQYVESLLPVLDLQYVESLLPVLDLHPYEELYNCLYPKMNLIILSQQRFPTEDHLMIHRHKHEMTLKFPSIKIDNMLSDQTPTPTRFLKNCEEVGLFSELDCSIEQEFRKAQEEEDNKQNISLQNLQNQQHHSRMGNHDNSIVIQQALPSPQSSSVITQAPSTNRQIGDLQSLNPNKIFSHRTPPLESRDLTEGREITKQESP
ncbi:unnamed protein product [Coregonus sp. 'balchen']|nr:unnamed protein product [Coregonus sp. 'balchen']